MRIEKSFQVAQPPTIVWDAFSDMRLVASCVPGASIDEELGDGRYSGHFSVKVGPLAASFSGEMTLAREDAQLVGTIEGKGADARSNSRASGSMTYRLEPEGSGTRVAVDCTMNLAGALAQFGKAAVMREIVNRITGEFVRNLEAHLGSRLPSADQVGPTIDLVNTDADSDLDPLPSATSNPEGEACSTTSHLAPAPASAPLDAGGLVWSIARDAIARIFRSLFGSRRRGP